jgi:hypothetical protein
MRCLARRSAQPYTRYGEHCNDASRLSAQLYANFLAFSKASSMVPTM